MSDIFSTSIRDGLSSETLKLLGPVLQGDLLTAIADSARDHWIKLAGRRLSSSRADYIAGIQAVDTSRKGVAVLALVGARPVEIERGTPAVDMHDILLGPEVRIAPPGQPGKRLRKDGGFYRAIPFRHAAPTSGYATGTPMGAAYRDVVADSKALGKSIYEAAKGLSATTGEAGGPVRWGGRLPQGMAPKAKPGHATDLYAGMVRMTPQAGKGRGSKYMTFRTISTGSPGWLRPAVPGVALIPEVKAHVEKVAPLAIQAFLSALGGP